jgi:hypothetical protein
MTNGEFERYWLSQNLVRVLDVHEQHLLRVASILSKRFPGIVFLWRLPGANQKYTISAIRWNGRRIAGPDEETIVAVGVAITRKLEKKHPVRRQRFLARLFHKPIQPGWRLSEG